MIILPLNFNLFLSGANQPRKDNTSQARQNALRTKAYNKAKQLEKRIADLKRANKPVPPQLLKELAEAHAQWSPSEALKTWEIIINNPKYANYTGRLEILGKYIVTGYIIIPKEKRPAVYAAIGDFFKIIEQKKGKLTPQEEQMKKNVQKAAANIGFFYARLAQPKK